jgi:hypothetical protein
MLEMDCQHFGLVVRTVLPSSVSAMSQVSTRSSIVAEALGRRLVNLVLVDIHFDLVAASACSRMVLLHYNYTHLEVCHVLVVLGVLVYLVIDSSHAGFASLGLVAVQEDRLVVPFALVMEEDHPDLVVSYSRAAAYFGSHWEEDLVDLVVVVDSGLVAVMGDILGVEAFDSVVEEMDFVVDHCKAVWSCHDSAVEVLDFEVAVLVANMDFLHRRTDSPSLHILQRPDCTLLDMIPAGKHFHYCTDPEVKVGDNLHVRNLGSIDFAMVARSMTDCTPWLEMLNAVRKLYLHMTRAKDSSKLASRVKWFRTGLVMWSEEPRWSLWSHDGVSSLFATAEPERACSLKGL